MYNFVLEKIVLPIGDLLNRSSYIQQLRYWRKVDGLSAEELKALQEKNLQKVLKYAVDQVPYYQNNVDSQKEISLENFPIINKQIIRNQTDDLISKEYKKENLIPYSSSGSSGVQTTVYMSKQEQSVLRGVLTHWWEWSGYQIGAPIVQTGMATSRSKLKALKDVLFRTDYVYAFSFTDDELKNICDRMRRKKNHYHLAGYASSLNVIAEYALENDYEIQLLSHINVNGA